MHVRCPHCHNPIEFAPDDDPLGEISCPLCGSSFRLVSGQETATHDRETTRTLGHFKLTQKLGTGAFGSVWKGRDTELDRVVAVKIPRKDQLDAAETEQFLREARAAAQLQHSNIVRVYEVGREEDTLYIVSELVEGLTLTDWLTGQRLTSKEAAGLCAKLADAVHHAHEAGVIHRDLKPSNVMLDAAGEPHVMDFGLAKREAGEITMTMEGKTLGTPAYMSPEQARGSAHHADRRSDVYSLGVILFELLTGERPFRGNVRMLLHRILNDDAPSPRTLNPGVPKDLDTICLKCLEKDPQKRYQTAQELGEELRRYLTGKPIQARPITRAARAWRWCKRNPRASSLSAALILALLGGLIGISTQWQRAEQHAASYRNEADKNLRLATQEAEAREHAEAEELRARRNHYVSDMNLAWKAWDEDNVRRAVDLLEAHRPPSAEDPDFRHFEWYSLWRLCHPDTQTLDHGGVISGVAFSPDGSRIAAGSVEGLVKVWNSETGEQITASKVYVQVRSVAIFPDGRILAAGCKGRSPIIKVWDVKSRACLHALKGHAKPVSCVAFSPANNALVSGSVDGTIKLWSLDNGEELLHLDNQGKVHALAISSDGARLVATDQSGHSIRVWDWKTRTQLLSVDVGSGLARAAAFSPQGKSFAYGTSQGKLGVVDLASGDRPFSVSAHPALISAVTFSPDGTTLASCSKDQTIRLWDVASGNQTAVLRGHCGEVRRLAFSPDGRRLASGSLNGTIRVWDLETDPYRGQLRGHTNSLRQVKFSPDGSLLASASVDGTLRFWNVEKETLLKTIETGESPHAVAFSPDGKTTVTGDSRGAIKFWDVATGNRKPIECEGHSVRITWLEYSRDGRFLASSGAREANVWPLANMTKVPLLRASSGWVPAATFSPDGKLLATTSADVQLWRVGDWKQAAKFNHPFSVNAAAFSPDGTTLATGAYYGPVRFWDVRTGRLKTRVAGHADKVMSLAFSPDGKRLASASWDGTIKIWDVKTFRPVATLKAGGRVESIAFSPDGKVLASAAGDSKTIRLWRMASADEVAGAAKTSR